jgi:AcrR family transcriptional regulator
MKVLYNMGEQSPNIIKQEMTRLSKNSRTQIMDSNRMLLLNAAINEFAQKGFSGANINSISLAAGFAKGTVYNYFSSKLALLLAAINYAGGLHIDFIQQKVREVDESKLRLYRFFDAGFDYVENNPAQARFLLSFLHSPDPDVRHEVSVSYQPLFQFVSDEIILVGIENGIFREVIKIEAATLLMTIYLGTASNVDQQGKILMDPRQVAEFTFRALQRIENTQEPGVTNEDPNHYWKSSTKREHRPDHRPVKTKPAG